VINYRLPTQHTHTHTHTYKKLSSKKNIFPTNWAEISISGLYFHLPPDSGLIEKKVIQMRKQIEAKQTMAGSVIHSKWVSLEGLMLTSMLTPSKNGSAAQQSILIKFLPSQALLNDLFLAF